MGHLYCTYSHYDGRDRTGQLVTHRHACINECTLRH